MRGRRFCFHSCNATEEADTDPLTKRVASGWYIRALNAQLALIKEGDVDALRNAAWMYQQGLGTDKNPAEALRLLRQAADLGDARAMFTLAEMYIAGTDVPKSVKTALEWYRKAAEVGYPEAMFEMGSRYAGGRDVKVGAMSKLNTTLSKLMPALGDRMAALQADRQQIDFRWRRT